jgi:hypothetical protein
MSQFDAHHRHLDSAVLVALLVESADLLVESADRLPIRSDDDQQWFLHAGHDDDGAHLPCR